MGIERCSQPRADVRFWSSVLIINMCADDSLEADKQRRRSGTCGTRFAGAILSGALDDERPNSEADII